MSNTKIKILITSIIFGLLFSTPTLATPSVSSGELIKGESFKAVYYKATDGKRYVFPNQRIYFSWYTDFSTVTIISDEELAAIPLGGNVYYRPNSRLVKITTDPKVYWVDRFGELRHILSEKVAQDLFGTDWISQIDDLPDAFFAGYTTGEPLDSSSLIEDPGVWTIDDNQGITAQKEDYQKEEEEEEEKEELVDKGEQPENINLTVITDNQNAVLTWFVTGGNTNYGFIILKSEEKNPSYPDDDYAKLLDSTATGYTWKSLPTGSAYHFRVCRLNSDGSCGTYSDDESVAFGTSSKTPSITLSGQVVSGVAKLSWQTYWLSPNYGFYLARDTNPNPKYPTHASIWIEKHRDNYDWSGLSVGTHHFRICRYNGTTYNTCSYYSNDLELEIK